MQADKGSRAFCSGNLGCGYPWGSDPGEREGLCGGEKRVNFIILTECKDCGDEIRVMPLIFNGSEVWREPRIHR